MEDRQYRHEYKYPLTQGQVLIEEARISAIAKKDLHAEQFGSYQIRSLYFDDYESSAFMDNENGVDNREKYRVRIYDHNAELIRLEVKQKIRGKTRKRFCRITKEQCRQLMSGELPTEIDAQQQLLSRLSYLMATRLMRPAVIVEYDRVPYVYRMQDANVRITFDSNIVAISDAETFLDEAVYGRGVLPVGEALMEVKFDSFLPDEIYGLLQLDHLQASTFSKYYFCRKFVL